LDSGGGVGDPATDGGEETRVGETTWGEGGRRSDEEGEGTFDSITSRGRTGLCELDTLDGDYKVVGVLGDGDADSKDLWVRARRVVRD
jgi:hypothetical protein